MGKKDDNEEEVSELAELHKKQALAAAAATNGDAVSNRLNNAKKKGVLYVTRGEAALIATTKVASFLKFDDASNFFYRAYLMFKTCQRWREAGDALKRCAEVQIQAKRSMEAAVLYTEAAETYFKIDKTETFKMIKLAISIFCDFGRFDISGKLERKIADMHYVSKHWYEAAIHYKKAASFLGGENLHEASENCWVKSAECLLELNELADAKKEYELIAKGCVESNLRKFNARDYFFLSIFCLIADPMKIIPVPVDPNFVKGTIEPEGPILDSINNASKIKYEFIKTTYNSYGKIDFLWNNSKELLFIKNLIKARLDWDRHMLADHLHYWNNVKPLTRNLLKMLNTLFVEIREEFERRHLRAARIAALEEKKLRREMRYKKQRELMNKMGVTGAVILEDDEEDIRLSSIINNGSGGGGEEESKEESVEGQDLGNADDVDENMVGNQDDSDEGEIEEPTEKKERKKRTIKRKS